MKSKSKLWLLHLCAWLLLLAGCSLDFSNDKQDAHQPYADEIDIQSIADLQHTAHFRQGALAHIFEGEINRRGDAVGFHFDGLPTKKGHVIAGTKTKANRYGVYEAKVEVDGVQKRSNHGKSTLFPESWNAQQVVDGINDAYDAKTHISGNTYEGLTSKGMRIHMYLDGNDKIISAFPVY